MEFEMAHPSRPGDFRFPRELGIRPVATRWITRLLRGRAQPVLPATPEIAATLSALAQPSGLGSPAQPVREVALVALLLTDLAELVESGKQHPTTGVDSIRVSRVIEAMQKDLAFAWTLAATAQLAGWRKSRFCKAYQRETGDIMIDCLNRLRVGKARGLLRSGRSTATEIAHGCGFSSSQYFAKVFREFTGLSASEYRKENPLVASLEKNNKKILTAQPGCYFISIETLPPRQQIPEIFNVIRQKTPPTELHPQNSVPTRLIP